MTDGDITRLNRMYKCPEFAKDDEFIESDDEMFDNSEEIEYTPLESMEDNIEDEEHDDENDEEQDDGPTEDEINFHNENSLQLADEKEHTLSAAMKLLKRIFKKNLRHILSLMKA